MLIWSPDDEYRGATSRMAERRAARSSRDDLSPGEPGGDRALSTRSLHALRAGGDVAPLGGGPVAGRGAAVPRDRAADGGVDDDGDSGGALAAARRGRVPAGVGSPEARDGARLSIAVPSKGRLREPCVELLHDAGLGPEQPGERALAFPCRNAPVDVLLVHAADIPEYVQDGGVDCGITGGGGLATAESRARTSSASAARA